MKICKETELIKYFNVVFPGYNKQKYVIETISEMSYKSKYGSKDGKEFENSLKPVFELFRDVLNVEIISGSGNTDILCTIEDPNRGTNHYKINVDAKTGSSANNLNPARIKRHIQKNCSKYCIVVAPRFSRGAVLDLQGFPIVIIKAESLAKYLIKECLSSEDAMADFNQINKLISTHLGGDITLLIEDLISEKYGISIKQQLLI